MTLSFDVGPVTLRRGARGRAAVVAGAPSLPNAGRYRHRAVIAREVRAWRAAASASARFAGLAPIRPDDSLLIRVVRLSPRASRTEDWAAPAALKPIRDGIADALWRTCRDAAHAGALLDAATRGKNPPLGCGHVHDDDPRIRWEPATEAAPRLGVRVVVIRTEAAA